MTARETIQTTIDKFNTHDLEGFCAQYAEDAVVYDPMYAKPLAGKQAIRQDMAGFMRAFPDSHDEVKRVLDKDGECALEMEIEATHDGPLATPEGEIPATGKPLKFGVGMFLRVDDQGKIVEEHRYYDAHGVLKQLGA